MTYSPKEVIARNFGLGAFRRITWSHLRIVPEELRDWNAPITLRGPTTLPQHPGCIWILEAIYCVTKTDVVFPLQIRKLVIAITRGRAVRQDLIKIGVCVVMKDGVPQSRITVNSRA